jgi:hypothetical protein
MIIANRAVASGFLHWGPGGEALGVVCDLRTPGSLTDVRNAAAHGGVLAVNRLATSGVDQDGQGAVSHREGLALINESRDRPSWPGDQEPTMAIRPG